MRRLSAVAVGAALLAAAVALPALAWWRTSGSGVATALGSSPSTVTLQQVTAAVTGTLVPGGSGALQLKLTNPNAVAVTVTGVTPTGTASSSSGSCVGSLLTVPARGGLTLSVPPGGSTVTVPAAATLASDAPSACQGVLFTVPLSVAVQL